MRVNWLLTGLALFQSGPGRVRPIEMSRFGINHKVEALVRFPKVRF